MNLNHLIHLYDSRNTSQKWLLRLFGVFLHYSSFVALIFVLSLIYDKLPFLGEIKTVFFLYFSFLISLINFLLIFGLAWIKIRPMFFIILLGYVIILISITIILRNSYNDLIYDELIQQNRKLKQ